MTAAATTHYDIADLVAMLRRQRELYVQLRELGQRQSPLVDQGQAEALLEVLGRRQVLIDELMRINQRVAPYREDWPRVWRQVPESDRALVSDLLNQVSDLLASILEQDDSDRRRLQSSHDSVKAELRRVQSAAVAARAYGTSPARVNAGTSPRFTDRQA